MFGGKKYICYSHLSEIILKWFLHKVGLSLSIKGPDKEKPRVNLHIENQPLGKMRRPLTAGPAAHSFNYS